MAQIFISYRRDDTEGDAGRLQDELKKYVGNNSVFLDVVGIRPGLSFRKEIKEALASCDVMLVVIGRDWVGIRDAAGERRLHDQKDVHRQEIGTAIQRGIPIVPILVRGGTLPARSELPDDLKPLEECQAHALRHDRWDIDVKLLIEKLSTFIPGIPHPELDSPTTRFTKISVLALVGSTITIGVAYPTLGLAFNWPHSGLFCTWLLIGLLMGKWHADHIGVNVVRDVLLGSAIAVSGTIVMSLEGPLYDKLPFWPIQIAEWRITILHMTMIMVSFIAGGLLPLLLEKGRAWTKRRIGLGGKA